MPAYRFCRSEDIPLLVESHNACLDEPRTESARWTVEDFKRAMREIDLWPSSCMLAHAGGDAVGVLLGAKRERANRIVSVVVRPGHRGQGHGRHMLESLAQKLAILGPRRIVAELEEGQSGARCFLERCGYRKERSFVDYVREGDGAVRPGEGLVAVGVHELERAGCLDHEAPRSWNGATERLLMRAERLSAAALPAGDRFAAWLVADDLPERPVRDVLAFGVADPDRVEPLLTLLFRGYAGTDTRPVRLHGVVEGAVDLAALTRMGFVAARRTVTLATVAGNERQ